MDSLFFSSPIGLGHATRDAAIASYFENKTKFVTGGPAVDFFNKVGFDDVMNIYFPPQFLVENGTLKKSLKWLWQYYRYYKECKKSANNIITIQNKTTPKIIISDEDFASLTIAQQQTIPNVLITDILETKFTRGISSLIEKKMNDSMTQIISKCNAVILPEHGSNQGNIKRVGPIVRKTNFSREELQNKFGFTKETIVISIGGTAAGSFLIEKSLDAIKKIKKNYDLVLVSGPSLKKKYNNVKNLGFIENLHEVIFASDLVISLAGKSTIDEANAYGTPGIFIPIKNHFEQENNAKQQGYTHSDIFRLESLIEEKMSTPRNKIKSCDGAYKAWQIIKQISAKYP